MSDQSNHLQNEGEKQFSRRGFISRSRGFIVKIGGIATGLTALIVGNGITPAAQASALGALECCYGAPPCSTGGSCPSGTHGLYTWYCSTLNPTRDWSCTDCYNNNHQLVCIAVNYTGT